MAVAAVLATVSAGALSGCTHHGSTSAQPTDQGWLARMNRVLDDPEGQGGGGAGLQSTTSEVALSYHLTGEWDVLETCTGTATVHVMVQALAPHTDDVRPTKTLGSGLVTCGATLRIPISVDSDGGVLLTAKPVGGPRSGQWDASIVRRGWSPQAS